MSSILARQLFLHQIMAYTILSDIQIKAIFLDCFNRVNQHLNSEDPLPELDTFLGKVNKELFPLNLEIRSGIDQETGKLFWAIVNTIEDEIAPMNTNYANIELTYLRGVIDGIILAKRNRYCLTFSEALNAKMVYAKEAGHDQSQSQIPDDDLSVPASKTLTKLDKQNLIDRFIDDDWLTRTKLGYIALSTRAILEFQFKLKAQYEDYLHDCSACSFIILNGFMCSFKECNYRIHPHCLASYIRIKGNTTSMLCPGGCKRPWNPKPLGPAAVQGSNDHQYSPSPHPDDENGDEEESSYV